MMRRLLILSFVSLYASQVLAVGNCKNIFDPTPQPNQPRIQTYQEMLDEGQRRDRRWNLVRNVFRLVGTGIIGYGLWDFMQWRDAVQEILDENNGIWVSPFTGESIDIRLLADMRSMTYLDLVEKFKNDGIVVVHVAEDSEFAYLNEGLPERDIAAIRADYESSNTNGGLRAYYLPRKQNFLIDDFGNTRSKPFKDKAIIAIGKLGEGKPGVLHHEYLHHQLIENNPNFHNLKIGDLDLTRREALLIKAAKSKMAVRALSSTKSVIEVDFEEFLGILMDAEKFQLDHKLHELSVYYLQLITADRMGLSDEMFMELANSAVSYCDEIKIELANQREVLHVFVTKLKDQNIAPLGILNEYQKQYTINRKIVADANQHFDSLMYQFGLVRIHHIAIE